MAGTQQIEKIDDGLIKFKDNKVSLKLERFDGIEIWYEYKFRNYDEILNKIIIQSVQKIV